MISRERFRLLLDAYGDAIMAATIRRERNRPDADQRAALGEVVATRKALEKAVFEP